jgi:hypothetical protein
MMAEYLPADIVNKVVQLLIQNGLYGSVKKYFKASEINGIMETN